MNIFISKLYSNKLSHKVGAAVGTKYAEACTRCTDTNKMHSLDNTFSSCEHENCLGLSKTGHAERVCTALSLCHTHSVKRLICVNSM